MDTGHPICLGPYLRAAYACKDSPHARKRACLLVIVHVTNAYTECTATHAVLSIGRRNYRKVRIPLRTTTFRKEFRRNCIHWTTIRNDLPMAIATVHMWWFLHFNGNIQVKSNLFATSKTHFESSENELISFRYKILVSIKLPSELHRNCLPIKNFIEKFVSTSNIRCHLEFLNTHSPNVQTIQSISKYSEFLTRQKFIFLQVSKTMSTSIDTDLEKYYGKSGEKIYIFSISRK